MKWPTRKFLLKWIAPPMALFLAVGLGWGVWRWATYPKAPDPKSSNFETMFNFVSGKDFDRMFESDRRQYVLAMVEKLRQKPFEELVALGMKRDPNYRVVGKKIRGMDDHEQIESAFLSLFLDKFYEMPEAKRTVYLMTFVTLQNSKLDEHPERMGLPSTDRFKRDMTRFISRMSPKIQAKTGQFLIDLRRQREVLGFPEYIQRTPDQAGS
ncbi:MAG: hypothetical protein IT447_08890 [Phycisphaerales bacterium]|jgi:hypothetical protein|nr:hypothetical protein [Phycisphaerales bacterium]